MKRSGFNLLVWALIGLTVVMACGLALMGYFIFTIHDRPALPAPPSSLRPACDPTRREGMTCPEGHLCLSGRCEPAPREDRICETGESCRDNCSCDLGLTCHRLTFQCVPREEQILAPLSCRVEPMKSAITKLAHKCTTRKASAGQLALGACGPTEWSSIAIKEADFNMLLAVFEDRFALHFPSGEPRSRGNWPSEAERAFYHQQIGAFRQPLREAKQIFIIGRASPDGDIDKNYRLSLRRIDLVAQLVDEVVNEGRSKADPARISLPIQQWGMKGEELILPKLYHDHYVAQTSGVVRTLTWEPEAQQWFTKLLGRVGAGDKLSPQDQEGLIHALNRVVLVIPIPCDGSEYDPAAIIPASVRSEAP